MNSTNIFRTPFKRSNLAICTILCIKGKKILYKLYTEHLRYIFLEIYLRGIFKKYMAKYI